MKRNLATLTPEEDAAWVGYFTFALGLHYGQKRADFYAWRRLCEEFPRLTGFDGCRA